MAAAAAARLDSLPELARRGDFQAVKQQLKTGSDPDETNAEGRSALHFACWHGSIAAARMLIRAGADVNLPDAYGTAPFHWALDSGHFDIVSLLINSGADPELVTRRGFAPLHTAIEKGRLDFARLLILAGADVNVRGDFAMSPLHLSVFYGREASVDLLIGAIANVDAQISSELKKVTPLTLAAFLKRPAILKKLLIAGADVNLADGINALHMSILSGDDKSCSMLLRAGVSMNHNDSLLAVTVALAKKKGFYGVLQLLKQAGYSLLTDVNSSDTIKVVRPCEVRSVIDDFKDFSESLSNSMKLAGFNSRNALVLSGAVDLMQDFTRIIQGNDFMFIFGSYADGWGSCLTGLDGNIDDDSDIDYVFIDWRNNLCLQEYCTRSGCQDLRVRYDNGHACCRIDASGPNATFPSFLSMAAVDFIGAVKCCCYPPIKILEPGYETQLASHIMDALNQVVADIQLCHVVTAACPGVENSMRVSTTVLERTVMHNLTTAQGQLFILLKYIVKKVLSSRVKGLKTYIVKNLLFFMLDRTQKNEWKPCNLMSLTEQALKLLIQMITNSAGENACMSHFFLRDAIVYFKSDQDPKETIKKCIEVVIKELPQLLQEFKSKLKSGPVNKIIFHPGLQIFLWSKFPVSSFYEIPEGQVQYHQTYNLVKLILKKLCDPLPRNERLSRETELMQLVHKLPDHAKTARECLEAMTRLKMGESWEVAVSCLSESSSVSTGIPLSILPAGETSVNCAKELVREYVESHDSLWRFAFYLGFDQQPDFGFLPESIRLVMQPLIRYGIWLLNFDALAKALRSNNPLPLIQDLREQFGDEVISAFLSSQKHQILNIIASSLNLSSRTDADTSEVVDHQLHQLSEPDLD